MDTAKTRPITKNFLRSAFDGFNDGLSIIYTIGNNNKKAINTLKKLIVINGISLPICFMKTPIVPSHIAANIINI